MFSFEEINCLGQFLDSTWGKSSTNGHATMAIRGKINDEKMTLIYTTLATAASEGVLSQQMPVLAEEGKQATNAYLKELKAHFKSAAGRALQTELLHASPSVEIINLQPHVSPKRTVAFRFTTTFKIS